MVPSLIRIKVPQHLRMIAEEHSIKEASPTISLRCYQYSGTLVVKVFTSCIKPEFLL